MEELKDVYNKTFGYWSDQNYENGDVARWVENARGVAAREGARRAAGLAAADPVARNLQEIEFDNGPHSMTRVQLRCRLHAATRKGRTT